MRTIGESYGPAMEITSQKEADEYLEALIDDCVQQTGKTRLECAEIQKSNLGYYAGYYSNDVRARVERLFRCVHPVFGAIAVNGAPSPEKAFAMGLEAGKAGKIKTPQPQPKEALDKERRKPRRIFDL